MLTHDQELVGFRKLYQTEPMYRAQLRSHTRNKPNIRMTEISRPAIHVLRHENHGLGTVGSVYHSFGFKRSTRRS